MRSAAGGRWEALDGAGKGPLLEAGSVAMSQKAKQGNRMFPAALAGRIRSSRVIPTRKTGQGKAESLFWAAYGDGRRQALERFLQSQKAGEARVQAQAERGRNFVKRVSLSVSLGCRARWPSRAS